MLRYRFVVIVLFVIAMRGNHLPKGNRKKRIRNRKPPVRGKQSNSNLCPSRSQAVYGFASIDSRSEVVVEDASIGAFSDGDDIDSFFGACLARNENYNGEIVGTIGVVNDVSNDAMECESEVDDGMDYDWENLADTEREREDVEAADSREIFGVELDELRDVLWQSDDDEDSSYEEESADTGPHGSFVLSNDCCNNCRRHKCTQVGSTQYRVQLRDCRVQKSRFSRKFSNYRWVDVVAAVRASRSSAASREFVRLKLCERCQEYLTSDISKNKANVVWPAMIWKWLSADMAIRQHGNKLWSLIPRDWRPWWLDSVRQLHSKYNQVTLEDPPCSFVDSTVKKETFETAIAMRQGAALAAACNEHLHATVWCPWGEAEYLHKCGSLPLDLIVNRLYGDCMMTIEGNARKEIQKVNGILDNYLDGGSRILYNPEWEVRPTIVFENGAPVVLTCRRHKSGCKGRYLHLPRNPRGTLPSLQCDQLTPAVVRPRTLKQLKVHQFSDSYQMREMQGQYNGVDTVRVCDHHEFSSDSKLLRDCEEVSLSGRTDLRALVGEWAQDGTLPSDVAEQRLADANRWTASSEEVQKCCDGATFVTLEDSLKLQKMNKEGRRHVVRVKQEDGWEERHYIPSWPSCLLNVHPLDEYGAHFPILPKMYDGMSDTRLVFYLAAMHATLPTLWQSSNDSIQTELSWEGWLLEYLGRKCFSTCVVKGRKNPFRFKSIGGQLASLSELLVRVGLRQDATESQVGGTNSTGLETSLNEDGHLGDDESDSTTSSYFGWNRTGSLHSVGTLGWDDESDSYNGDDISADDDASMGWASQEEARQLHTDGLFHAEDLKQLFGGHGDVIVGSSEELPRMLDGVAENVNSMIVYRAEQIPMQSHPDPSLATELQCQRGCLWELRFVGGCSTSCTNNRFILARHGGVFSGWWKQTYQNVKSYDYHHQRWRGSRISSECRGWDVAVYVRKRSVPLEQCRDVILHAMGSQTKIFCQEHDVPLITAPFSTKVDCCLTGSSNTPCSRSINWRCPVKDCKSAVCKAHEERHRKRESPVFVRPQSVFVEENVMDVEDGDSNHEESSSATGSEWLPNEDDELSFFSSYGSEDEEFADSETELDDQLCSDVRDDLLLDTIWDEHVPMDVDNPDAQTYGENVIPVSCNAEEPLRVHGDPSSIPGCCILNNMGSLLVRRGSKLRGSMNQRFFLQRIVGTTPGRAVPLIYPEAMLFPSLFWKDAGNDGAILGALPCGLLAHDSTLEKYGIASIQSHLYSRLTNPTIGTSANPDYVCHAFDSMVNLGCRHEDVRVILHRGVTGTDDGVRVGDSGPGSVTDKSFFDTDSVDSRPVVNRLAAAVADRQATYFYTHTANASDHFGLSPIKKWIEGDAVMDILCDGTETALQREEVRRSLRQEASVWLLRNWIRVQ